MSTALKTDDLKAAASTPRVSSLVVPVYTATIFLSAALLFSVQPMLGKMVLPILGGTPAVWNTCMVFFQASLLLGYLYSHEVAWGAPSYDSPPCATGADIADFADCSSW